ncbi:hypothetical protein LTR27_004922 [Elasticomyces elasticus]|nr:hypothetical protein LTR27_004922 [Elasticomyces elasticus]
MDDAISSPQRVSRYRSQRRAQQAQQEEETPEVPPIPQEDAPADNGPARTRSRYHRKNANGQRPATARDQDGHNAPQSPPVPAALPLTASVPQHQRSKSTARRYHERHASPPVQLGAFDERGGNVDADGYGDDDVGAYRANDYDATREVARPVMPPSQPSGELFPPPRPDVSTERPVTKDGPPASNQISATRSTSELLKYADVEDDDDRGGCFGLFKRKRGEASPGADGKASKTKPPPALQDIPVSAVNAGDRKVLVECGKSKTIFPVTSTTTTVDIIKSAANCMSERINPRSAVMLENFGSVGVQRPLRRYEHIWDVMNSWDNDKQNSLILLDPGTGSSEVELSVAGVPHKKPGDIEWLMTYSQKVGKWDKRTILLRPDGQVVVLKDPSKPKEADSICHLSDFDIYTPTQEKARKKIKPPKKHCFAVKSQQKSIMFETTQNFVHFFCTNDRQTADDFYAAIQGWRSWYLVNVMDEGKKPKVPVVARRSIDHEAGARHNAHKPGESFDSHYQLGSFRPLVDFNEFGDRPSTAKSANGPAANGFVKSANQFDPMVSPERRRSTRVKQPLVPVGNKVLADDEPLANLPERRKSVKTKQHSPVALGGKILADDEPLANLERQTSRDQKRVSMDNTRPEEFAAKGLLGKTYSQRQREQSEKENHKQQAFVGGPNLLNSGYNGDREEHESRRRSLDLPQRGKSTRTRPEPRANGSGGDVKRNKSTRHPGTSGSGSGSGSGDLGRSASTRAREKMPAPLVDLRPQYQAPPQHVKKGKGHIPEQVHPGGLIEAATSPEDLIGAPPATDWRGRNGQNGSPSLQPPQQGSQPRSRSRPEQRPSTSRSPHSGDNGAFTGEGLLAGQHAQSGWGGGDRGRGVVDNRSNGKPLVDMNEPSRFVPGSLLNKVDRQHGQQKPVIDRENGA